MEPDPQPPAPQHQPPSHLPPEMLPPINTTPTHVEHHSEDLLEPDEQELAVVRRHPIGIIGIYLESLIGLLVVGSVFFLVGPDFLNGLSSRAYPILIAVVVFGLA